MHLANIRYIVLFVKKKVILHNKIGVCIHFMSTPEQNHTTE